MYTALVIKVWCVIIKYQYKYHSKLQSVEKCVLIYSVYGGYPNKFISSLSYILMYFVL